MWNVLRIADTRPTGCERNPHGQDAHATAKPMSLDIHPTDLPTLQPLRDRYRQEMNCQIIHDSIHIRPGWTREYLLRLNDQPAGYASIAIAGPWKDKPTLYEFYLLLE